MQAGEAIEPVEAGAAIVVLLLLLLLLLLPVAAGVASGRAVTLPRPGTPLIVLIVTGEMGAGGRGGGFETGVGELAGQTAEIFAHVPGQAGIGGADADVDFACAVGYAKLDARIGRVADLQRDLLSGPGRGVGRSFGGVADFGRSRRRGGC